MPVAEFMDARGNVERVTARAAADGAYTVRGTKFHPYAEFGTTRAYCAQRDPLHPLHPLLEVALPLPLGGVLYPAPVLWLSPQGIEWHWKPAVRAAQDVSAAALLEEQEPHVEESTLVSDDGEEDSSECEESDEESEDDEELKSAACAFAESSTACAARR